MYLASSRGNLAVTKARGALTATFHAVRGPRIVPFGMSALSLASAPALFSALADDFAVERFFSVAAPSAPATLTASGTARAILEYCATVLRNAAPNILA